jgi:hypothetical protein
MPRVAKSLGGAQQTPMQGRDCRGALISIKILSPCRYEKLISIVLAHFVAV